MLQCRTQYSVYPSLFYRTLPAVLTVIQFWRKGFLSRLVAAVLALYLFDISVDFQYHCDIEDNTTINEIESMSELVLEEVADFEGLFEEIPESDREPGAKVSFLLVFLLPVQFGFQPAFQITESKFHAKDKYAFYSAHFPI